jgi:diguanylate cyclase (GGDEF)-like protein
MLQQTDGRVRSVGLFLNPAGQRRIDFQTAFAERFGRLFLADGSEQAGTLLAQQQVDLLVIDLARFERSIDLASIGALVTQRRGAPTLLVCPFTNAGWVPELMAFGPLDYVIGPLLDADLAQHIDTLLTGAWADQRAAQQDDATGLRRLLTIRSRLQQALLDVEDLNGLATQACALLGEWPGVVHASLFHLKEHGNLMLEAQHAPNGLDLARLLQRGERLLHSPLRDVFPGLLAVCTGELSLLDAPEKAGDPELAMALRDKGVALLLALPIAAVGPGAPSGSICLMFESAPRFSLDQLATLADLAQLIGFGLRMAELSREAETLLVRLTYQATNDALTGVANRRHGEELLEQEIRRARRYKAPLALIAFDIDHFKDLNDRYGHPCGDVALRTVADTALALLRACDVLVRSGGEEFQIIVPHTSAIDALKIAEKIRLAIEQTAIPGCDRLSISLGVGQLSEQESGDELVLRVVAAVARAKRAGRNCVELAMA